MEWEFVVSVGIGVGDEQDGGAEGMRVVLHLCLLTLGLLHVGVHHQCGPPPLSQM